MGPFNVIQSARSAYHLLIAERRYLLRLAIVPAFIKLVCYTAGLSMGYENNLVRMALILLPASLVEGWMLAHLVRLIVLNQRWPFQPSGNEEADMAVLETRMYGIMGGLITYVLINLLVAGALALVASTGSLDAETVPPGQALAMMTGLIAMVWAFPLLWLYIPMAAGADTLAWLKNFRGLRVSLSMIGVWLLCYLPIAAMTLFGISAILGPFKGGDIPAGANFAVIIVSVILDTAKALLATAGMTYAVKDFYTPKKQGVFE